MACRRSLKSIEKVDDYTVEFMLNQPNAPILANLAMDFAVDPRPNMPTSSKRRQARAVRPGPVGTGPFQFVDYQKDAVIRYKANQDYWAGKARRSTTSSSRSRPIRRRATPKLKAGECQVMAVSEPGRPRRDEEGPDLKLMEQAGPQHRLLAFNTQKPPFDKKEVRQALNMAIDKEAIIKDVYLGAGAGSPRT